MLALTTANWIVWIFIILAVGYLFGDAIMGFLRRRKKVIFIKDLRRRK